MADASSSSEAAAAATPVPTEGAAVPPPAEATAATTTGTGEETPASSTSSPDAAADAPPPPTAATTPTPAAAVVKKEKKDGSAAAAPAPPLPTADPNLQIPKASVKRIMKLDPDTKNLSQDAIVLVGKATELFVDRLARASQKMALANRRKTIKYEDIADARVSDKNMEFLDGVIPHY